MKTFTNFLFFFLYFVYSGLALAHDLIIKVSFNEARLYVLNDVGETVNTFPVALPKNKVTLPITGTVIKAERNPSWGPTKKGRDLYFKKFGKVLPEIVGPGDPLNAMGVGKLYIDFDDPRVNKLIRIHGTNDEKSIGNRVSSGCIRLKNKDILALIHIIEGSKVRVVFDT